ncbi:unnamed protein product [Arabidopsis thaliana]|uniref:Uncharacterized protein n=2 Tax=Arabidopsis thaliana TaxID=3702 RepID=A0A5S9WY40_ARATH|nr:unnamed protein product [Arabidopsis thaliana]
MAGSLASRKLKSFAGKGSPKRRPSPKPSNTNVPQMEEVTKTSTTIKKKKVTKAAKPKEGEEESRISPDPPA